MIVFCNTFGKANRPILTIMLSRVAISCTKFNAFCLHENKTEESDSRDIRSKKCDRMLNIRSKKCDEAFRIHWKNYDGPAIIRLKKCIFVPKNTSDYAEKED